MQTANHTVSMLNAQLKTVQIVGLEALAGILAEAATCDPHDAGQLPIVEAVSSNGTWLLAFQVENSAVVIQMDRLAA